MQQAASPALIEMMLADQERAGEELVEAPSPIDEPPPPPAPEPLRIEPPGWEAEARERAARGDELRGMDAVYAAGAPRPVMPPPPWKDEPVVPSAEGTTSKTPRLDQVKAWRRT
jgi:hypothetical protein